MKRIVILAAIIVVAFSVYSASRTPQSTSQAKPSPGAIGQTVTNGNWSVTLMDFGPWERFSPSRQPSPLPQGRLLVADFRISSRHASTSNFTQSDFELRAGDGRQFKPAQWTATIERGFVISQTVQPGLATENRVVFDVDPQARDLTLRALGTNWSVPAP